MTVVTGKALDEALGDMLRCKNAFHSTPAAAARADGYRCVLNNHGVDFDGRVSHGDLAEEKFTDWEQDLCSVYGQRTAHHSDYFAKTTCDLGLASWLEANHGWAWCVSLVCETQLILPEYLAGRKKNHLPYKRAETTGETAGELANDSVIERGIIAELSVSWPCQVL